MKKIKELWNQNRVLFMLFIIVFICIFVILGVVITSFLGSSKSVYGDRLEGVEQVTLTEEFKENFKNTLQEDELIQDVNIKNKGKIIYVTLVFKESISLVEAESKALASLGQFSQEYTSFYDFHYTLKQNASEGNEGFLIMGAKNVNGNGLVWNNNTEVPA